MIYVPSAYCARCREPLQVRQDDGGTGDLYITMTRTDDLVTLTFEALCKNMRACTERQIANAET